MSLNFLELATICHIRLLELQTRWRFSRISSPYASLELGDLLFSGIMFVKSVFCTLIRNLEVVESQFCSFELKRDVLTFLKKIDDRIMSFRWETKSSKVKAFYSCLIHK